MAVEMGASCMPVWSSGVETRVLLPGERERRGSAILHALRVHDIGNSWGDDQWCQRRCLIHTLLPSCIHRALDSVGNDGLLVLLLLLLC